MGQDNRYITSADNRTVKPVTPFVPKAAPNLPAVAAGVSLYGIALY